MRPIAFTPYSGRFLTLHTADCAGQFLRRGKILNFWSREKMTDEITEALEKIFSFDSVL